MTKSYRQGQILKLIRDLQQRKKTAVMSGVTAPDRSVREPGS